MPTATYGFDLKVTLKYRDEYEKDNVFISGLLLFTGITSCEDRFEEANTNHNKNIHCSLAGCIFLVQFIKVLIVWQR